MILLGPEDHVSCQLYSSSCSEVGSQLIYTLMASPCSDPTPLNETSERILTVESKPYSSTETKEFGNEGGPQICKLSSGLSGPQCMRHHFGERGPG